MTKPKSKSVKSVSEPLVPEYEQLLGRIDLLILTARSFAARAANAVITATYWDAGRQIVEFEQGGKARAAYGAALLERLSADLSTKHGRGFSVDNLERFRLFYLRFPLSGISATSLRKSEPAKRTANASRMRCKSPAGNQKTRRAEIRDSGLGRNPLGGANIFRNPEDFPAPPAFPKKLRLIAKFPLFPLAQPT